MENCKCKVCGKEFWYGDENSPCLIDKKWRKIVNFYNLGLYEKKASKLYAKNFHKWEELNGYDWETPNEFIDKDEYHLYICSDCMERALGRKIMPSDLSTSKAKTDGLDWYYNKAFEEKHFK